MILSFCQRNRMEHPATLPDRQIDQPPLPNATTSRYSPLSKNPAALAAYLNKAMQRNGGSSRLDIDTLHPPSADGGRSAKEIVSTMLMIDASFNLRYAARNHTLGFGGNHSVELLVRQQKIL